MAARTWTMEQRQKQREAIERWKPWKQSTGPKSAEGKSATAGNVWTGGELKKLRLAIKELNGAMRAQRNQLGR